MKKFYSFMMLVALTLFSSNAFAEAGDVTVNADIDFTNTPSKGILQGEVNQITLSGSTYIDEGVLRTVDETNVVTIPEEEYAGKKDVVTISFDKAWGNKNAMGSGIRVLDANGEYIATFQHARWDGKSTNANTLNIDMAGLVATHNGNKPIYDRATHFEISIDYKQKLITTVVTCTNLNATATFTAALTNTNPVASFEHYAYGVSANTDRADSFDNLKITTTEGDYNVAVANYTVKWVCGDEEIKESEERTGDAGDPITLLDADKVKIKNADGTKKYEYVSDDAAEATIAADGSTVVTITFQEIATFDYKVTAAIGDDETVELAAGTLFNDETQTVYWSKYMQSSEGSWFETDPDFGLEVSVTDPEFIVEYRPCDINYFYEIEKMKTSKAAATSAGGLNYSGGSALGHTTSARFYTDEAVEGGKYKVTLVGKARRSGGESMGISYIDAAGNVIDTGASVSWSNENTEDIEKVLEDVEIPSCSGIALVNLNAWNSTAYMDYITLEKTGEQDNYKVTVSEAENGTVTADVTEAVFGDKVTLTVEPAEGYLAKEVKVTYIKTTVTPAESEEEDDIVTNEEIEVPVADDYTFTMPQADVTVTATFDKAYTVTTTAENGTVSADKEQAIEGDKVTLTITPDAGYDFKAVSAVDGAGNTVEIAEDNTFTMPASDVTVTADFEEKVITIDTDMTSSFAALTEASNWTTIEGKAAGWTGTWACPAVEINGIGTKQVCEYYRGSCDYTGDVLYQTVTGLAPGTYKIELYGGAAFTCTRGFGSTAFTGDLSVDHNDAYTEGYKIEPETESTGVSLTATTSVNTYGGEIPIFYAQTFPEGASVVTLDGVVVGDDGEVKLAMSKTTTSTNWHVIQLKGVTATVNAKDALAAAVARAEAVDTEKLPESIVNELTQAVADNNKMYDTAEEYIAAIDAIDAATAKANKYAAASEYFEKMAAVLDKTNVYTEEAYNSVYGTWKQAYDEGTLDEAILSTLTSDLAYSSGWHAANNIDDVLLSAWTIGDTQCKDYTAGMYINTWSVEGDSDGSEFKVPFFEYWTGDANSLGANTLTATVTGLEAGKSYKATAWVRARLKNGGEAPTTGITLKVGDGEAVDVCAGENVEGTPFYLAEFTATGTADESGNLTITFEVAEDNNVSWISFRDVMYEVNAVKNEPGEYKNTPMDKDMFKGWDGFDDYAKVNNENPYWDALELPAEASAGNTVYGSGNVTNTDYADVTGAEVLRINGTPGTQLRVLMNRQADNSLVELNPTIGEDGYVDVDLTPYEYVHINAIKLGWGSPAGTISSFILNPYDPTAYTAESYIGSSYEGIPVEIDLEGILELIGATEDTYKVVAEYADGSRADNVRGTTDGWRDAEGNAKAWADKVENAPDFYLQDSEEGNVFYMGGYPGRTEEENSFTGTLVFINTETNAEQKVTFTLNYIPVPPIEREIADVTIVKTVEYAHADGSYTQKVVELTEDEIAQITAALGIESLADAQIFGYNPTEEKFIADHANYDGWRAASGDFALWSGDFNVPACVKIQEGEALTPADGKFFTYNISQSVGTVKTYWAYANDETAVLVEVDVVYPDGFNVTVAETENGTVEAKYAALAEGVTETLTVTPDEGYQLKEIKATYTKVTPAEEEGGEDTTEEVAVELTENEDGTYSFAMPAGDVTVTATFYDPTSIGKDDNSSGWWQEFSDFYNLEKGQTAFISFDNYNDGGDNWHNWLYVTQKPNTGVYGAGADEYGAIRCDNFGWGSSYNASSLSNDYDWSTFMADMNGSHVEATLGMNEDGEIVMNSVITTADGKTYNYSYTSLPVAEDGFEFFYTVENAHLKNFKVTIEDVPVGINRINLDGADFATDLENALRNGKVFDLSGRQMRTITSNGIYIVNGKKVAIKK